ncbi:MAG: response regulator [Chloroflexales bacterium]|nr:response regulator [Chloroflexales bacterium]
MTELTPGQPTGDTQSGAGGGQRLSEQQYRVLFDTMLQGVVYQDSSGQIVAMNPAAERILGQGIEEIAGRTSEDLAHATLREDGAPFPGAEHPAMVALRTGRSVSNVVMGVFNPREQAYRWIMISAVPLFGQEAATPYQVYTIFEDITARKQVDAQLHQSEALAATAFRANPAAMSITRLRDGRFIDINASHERLFGYSREELIGHTADEIAIYADPAQRADVVRIMREQGSLREVELTLRTRSGELREVLCSLESLELYGEACILGCVIDITTRKQTEQTLRASEERFRRVFVATPTPKLITQVDTQQIIDANPAFAAMTGYALGELRGQTTDALGLWPKTPLDAAGRAQLHQDGRLTDLESPLRTRDGSIRELLLSLVAVELDGVACYLTVMLDQTERTRALAARSIAEQALEAERALLARRVDERTADLSHANAELARAARLKDEFLANMSHELRTPLNAILGRSEALQEAIYGPISPRQAEALRSIEASGHHLLSLINDILDLSKIESGKLELEYTAVDIGQICHASLSMVAQIALTKHISVSSNRDGLVAVGWGDERRLKQVLVNLLSNAVKFTPEGGKVGLEVDGDTAERTLTFTVWDTGIGIAADDLPKLFQPFVQIDSSLSRQYEGTGLGLALVLRLTEAHGGSVAVESTPGQGSRFRVILPWEPGAAASDLTVPAANADTFVPVIGQVLVVEDSATAADQVVRYLHEFGARVEVHAHGRGTVKRARVLQPDVILLDLLLPDQDGWEVLRRLKAEPRTRDIPVIIVSVVDEPARGQALGAAALVRKPIDRAALRQVLGQVAARPDEPSTDWVRDIPTAAPRPRLLLAEDNQANIDVLYDYLQAKGYAVTVARNGAEALVHAQEGAPEAILMDIQMPIMDGLEAIRRIRADPALGRVPIIAVTALAMPGDRERCLATGADDYQTKPVNLRRLVAQIEALRHGRA